MELKNLLLASAVLFSMAACSDEEVVNNQTEGSQGDAYMSLSIEMPRLGSNTRAINTGTETHAGTQWEQEISKLLLLVYNADNHDALEYKHTYVGADLRPNKPSVGNDNSTLYTVAPFALTSGNKKVVVIVNPLDANQGGTLTENSVLADMRKVMTMTAKQVEAVSSNGKFMMTNANTIANQNQAGIAISQTGKVKDGDFYQDGSVAVYAQGSKTNPTSVVIPVERVVAKIEDVTQNYTIPVANSQDKVHFQKVALINGNTQFYPIKLIRQQADHLNDYVVDPNFADNSAATLKDFYSKTFNNNPFEQSAQNTDVIVKDLPAHPNQLKACFYTLENTMMANQQMNAYTTGLYYKATYELSGTPEGTHIYQYGGKLYNYENLKNVPGLQLGQLTDASTQDEFDAIGVVKYEKGVCYYPYWIRHISNGNPQEMGPMEFAVVRNNYYQMEINTVKGIGQYKPEVPGEHTPDEEANSYLDIKVKVLPWVVRKNQIDF